MNKLVCICAGGTGGHINAALSLGEYFKERDFEVTYYSGTRYLDYQLFGPVRERTLHLDSKPLRGKNPLILLKNALLNIFVFSTTLSKLFSKRPIAVIGAGGYVCGPVLLAAKVLGIKTYIIEQNAVAGLTNKLLARITNKIFVNFHNTKGINASSKVVVAGNPIRSSISYSPISPSEPYNVLVFGGSLGANQINDVVKELLKKEWSKKLSIRHQVGKGNLEELSVREGVEYRQAEYFNNMDEMYRWAHIVVARAGASTISELREARRASILIPFPFATDNHQEINAQELEKEKLFHVKIINQDLSVSEMKEEVGEEIEKIIESNLFHPFREDAGLDSCKIIFKEVMNDVRNK